MTARVIGYVRQSLGRANETEDTSLSLDAQEARLRAWAARESATLIDVIRDHDVKGSDPDRAGMRRLLDVAASGTIDAIVVLAMSRFARDHVWQEIHWRQLKAHKVKVISLTEPNLEHTLMRGMLGVVGQYQSEQIGQFVAAAFATRHQRGLHHGTPPYGWDAGKEGGIITPNITESPIVLTLYDRMIAGDHLPALTVWLTVSGVPPRRGDAWCEGTVQRIVTNPVHAGMVVLHGNALPGQHPPLIDPERWALAQTLLQRRPVVKRKAVTSWVEGIIEHECGARMYMAPVRPRNGILYATFGCATMAGNRALRCGVDRPYLSQRKAEAGAVVAVRCALRSVRGVRASWQDAVDRAGGDVARRHRAGIEKDLAAIASRRAALVTLWESGRVRDLGDYDDRMITIDRDDARLRDELAASAAIPDIATFEAADALRVHVLAHLDRMPGSDIATVIGTIGMLVAGADGVRLDGRGVWADVIGGVR